MNAAAPAGRMLGAHAVSPIGLGCMNLSHAYGVPPSAQAARALLEAALDLGVDHFDTAALYGFGRNEALVGEVLAPVRERFFLASKCGMTGVDGKRVIDGRPATLKQTCEDSLRRLRTDRIDLYYLHRMDRSVPIEDSVGALADLVRAGSIRAIVGTTSIAHLREDLAAATLAIDPAIIARADACVDDATISGPRYPAATLAEIDTEEPQDLST